MKYCEVMGLGLVFAMGVRGEVSVSVSESLGVGVRTW